MQQNNTDEMKALIFDGATLRLCTVPVPARKTGETLTRVTAAGICTTDHEILRGYYPRIPRNTRP